MATTNRYLVTGARGQDGLILISKFAAQGHDVLGVVRKQADADFVKLYEPKVKVICLDLLDKDAVTKMLEEYSPTHIFNLAAESSVINHHVEQMRPSFMVFTRARHRRAKAFYSAGRTHMRGESTGLALSFFAKALLQSPIFFRTYVAITLTLINLLRRKSQ